MTHHIPSRHLGSRQTRLEWFKTFVNSKHCGDGPKAWSWTNWARIESRTPQEQREYRLHDNLAFRIFRPLWYWQSFKFCLLTWILAFQFWWCVWLYIWSSRRRRLSNIHMYNSAPQQVVNTELWSLYGSIINIIDNTSLDVYCTWGATLAFYPFSSIPNRLCSLIIVIFKRFWLR